MYCAIYWRFEAKVTDLRSFDTTEELVDWMCHQKALEPIAIIGIYEKNEMFREVEKDIKTFKKYIKD